MGNAGRDMSKLFLGDEGAAGMLLDLEDESG
jgi:hypothetical protein